MSLQPPASKPLAKKFLLKTSDYRASFKGSLVIRRPLLSLYIKNNDREAHRLGITASAKSGTAVTRNRIKRICRELYRTLDLSRWVEGLDIHIYVGNPKEKRDFKNVRSEEFRETLVLALEEGLKRFKPNKPSSH